MGAGADRARLGECDSKAREKSTATCRVFRAVVYVGAKAPTYKDLGSGYRFCRRFSYGLILGSCGCDYYSACEDE